MESNLTNKQRLFVREYLIDFNATQAAIRAGYSKKTARIIGAQNLSKLNIQRALQKAIEERGKRTEMEADRVLKELALIAFSDMKDYVDILDDGSLRMKPFDEMPEGASRVISQIKETVTTLRKSKDDSEVLTRRIGYKHHSKEKALEMLGRHLGMFIEKSEITIKDYETFELPALKTPEMIAKEKDNNGY